MLPVKVKIRKKPIKMMEHPKLSENDNSMRIIDMEII